MANSIGPPSLTHANVMLHMHKQEAAHQGQPNSGGSFFTFIRYFGFGFLMVRLLSFEACGVRYFSL